MPREYNKKHQIWYETEGDVVKVGFTTNFLTEMAECWHIVPSTNGEVREKSPLMAVETNDCLLSIQSPASGMVQEFNPKALNFPDRLTSDDIILMINKKAVAVQEEVAPVVQDRWVLPQAVLRGNDPIDWGALTTAAPLRGLGDTRVAPVPADPLRTLRNEANRVRRDQMIRDFEAMQAAQQQQVMVAPAPTAPTARIPRNRNQ